MAQGQPTIDTASPQLVKLSVERMTSFVAAAFLACQMAAKDARRVAELMIEADLIGASSHGIFRLPEYVATIRKGLINPRPKIRVDRTAASAALVDGDNGMGHLAGDEAARTAIDLARGSGVGWVGVRNSNHAGAGAVYAAMPLEHGMVGIYAAVAAANHMAPWGSGEPLLGTNPLTIAIPAGEGAPFLFDMATSTSSFGVIKNLAQRGESLPESWMIDRRTGEALTDSAAINQGVLTPMGNHKGSGLSIAIGLLAGVLNGAGFGRDVRSFDKPATGAANVGQLVIALDPSRFLPRAVFEAEVARHLADIAASSPLPGVERVRYPGERRHLLRTEQLASGIALEPELITRLNTLAGQLNLKPLNDA